MSTILRFLKSPLLSVFIGIVGIAASWYFYEKGKSDAVAEAVEAGKAEGHAQGLKEANAAFEINLPELLQREYGAEVGRAKSTGFAEGRAAAAKECTLQRNVEENWRNYDSVVRRLASLASVLQKYPNDTDYRENFRAQARSIVETAKDLRTAYENQAAVFNSVIDDMRKALEAANYPALRRYALSLAESLESKRAQFLRANEQIGTSFANLAPRKK